MTTAPNDTQRKVIASLIENSRYELIPLKNFQKVAEDLPPGVPVTVTTSEAHGIEMTLSSAEWLAARGHQVTPHLASRSVRDRAHLTDLVARMKAAGFRKLFVVGGDGKPVGQIPDGLTLLRTLHEVGHHFEEIGVPAYPEGHSSIPDDVLRRDIKAKQEYAQVMATQMAFNPDAIASWLAERRRDGVTLTMYLGVPGVMELTKLMTIAARIGVATSAKYLLKNRSLLGYLMSRDSYGPDALLNSLAPTFADPSSNVRGLHIFTMNQVAPTVAWARTMMEKLGQPVG